MTPIQTNDQLFEQINRIIPGLPSHIVKLELCIEYGHPLGTPSPIVKVEFFPCVNDEPVWKDGPVRKVFNIVEVEDPQPEEKDPQ
jgi:hypothetical protein